MPSLDGEGCVSTYHECMTRQAGEGGEQMRDLKPVRCPCYEVSLISPLTYPVNEIYGKKVKEVGS